MKDLFSQKEGFDNWLHAMEQLSNCQNGYLLADFIDRYIDFIN